MTADDPLLRFYRLDGTDAGGRTLPEIWAWDAARLEGVHDYIQWLFPLPEPSAFNPHAPILTRETIETFRADPELRQRLLRSLALMLDFYGLALESDGNGTPRIERARDYAQKSAGRQRPGDHNHLRLTRILTSARLLGLDDHSRALYRCLAAIARDHPHAVSATTLAYWQRSTASS
ncbi:MAG: opioid growth factor receptor-related protein [Vicinamibacteria bacterium]